MSETEIKEMAVSLDSDDYRDIMEEFEIRKDRMLPDGESCKHGAMLGEIVRDLWEYRAIRERERQEKE